MVPKSADTDVSDQQKTFPECWILSAGSEGIRRLAMQLRPNGFFPQGSEAVAADCQCLIPGFESQQRLCP